VFTLLPSTGCNMLADGKNIEGVRLLQQGQPQAALQQFQQVAANNPTNADAYYNMAATYHRLGSQSKDKQQFDQAEALYNQCLDLNENHVDCRRGLAVLLAETNRSDRAFNLLKNWVDSNPRSADARIELARLYEEFGDVETAKLHLNQAILADENSHRAWAALGRIREQLGDSEQALANYQRSYRLNTFQPQIAERITMLSQSATNGVDATIPGNTRIVTRPAPRY
jgi:tetratricopeptide (TPR) repeat protein